MKSDAFEEIPESGSVRVDAIFKLPRANANKDTQAHRMDYSALNFATDECIQHPDEGDELTLMLTFKKVKRVMRATVIEVYRFNHHKRGKLVWDIKYAD